MINFDDLINESGWLKSIAKLEQANIKYGDTVVETNKRIRQSMAETLAEMNKARDAVSGYDNSKKGGLQEINKMAEGISDLTTAYKNQSTALAQNTSVVDSNNRVIVQAKSRLSELQKEYEKLDLSQKRDIQRKKEIEREIIQTTRSLNGLVAATNSSSRTIRAAEDSFNALKQSTKELKAQLDALPNAYDKSTGKLNQQNKAAVALNAEYQKSLKLQKQIEQGQGNFRGNVGNYPKGNGAFNMLGELTGLGGVASVAGIGAVIASAGAAVLEVGQEYEKLQLLTENALNNNKKAAAEANAVIRDFADNSPHDLEGVTKAYTRLVDIGIIPAKEQLTEISDIAVAKNKTVMDYVEAIADAQQGEFERLKEFGIDASKAGDKVNFTFKGVRTTVQNNSQAISEYLISLGKVPGVMGATDKLAQSFSGRWSTIKDGLKGIASDIFQFFLPALNAVAGVIAKGVGLLGRFTTGLKQMGKEQGVWITLFKFVANPSGATKEAWDAQSRAPKINSNSTPELDKARKQLQEQQKINEAKRKAQDKAAEDAKKADKVLSDTLSAKKASNDVELAQLEAKKEDGLITEKEFIEKRKQITLAGISERQAILARAGKKETDDYKKLAADKLAVETQYKRDSLKLALASSKSDADRAIAGLGRDKEDGSITNEQYLERKRGVLIASLNEQKQLLISAGQSQSALVKDIDRQLLEADEEYFRDRLKLAKAAWKEELQAARDGLNEIDQKTQAAYDDSLVSIRQQYNNLRRQVGSDLINNKISQKEADKRLQLIDLNELKAEIAAYRTAIEEDRRLSDELIDHKIEKLKEYQSANGRTASEIATAQQAIDDLLKQKAKDLADDKIKLDKKVAANAIEQSNMIADNEQENNKKRKATAAETAEAVGQIIQTIGDGLFQAEQQRLQNQMTALDRQQAYEISLVEGNEGAKNAVMQKFDAERKALQHKQDVQTRQRAIFEIITATAINIAKNPALGLLSALMGLASILTTALPPLPQYAEGKNVSDTYEGPAEVGEAGRELLFRDGRATLIDKPSVINVKRKDIILPNRLTERMLSDEHAWAANSILHRSSVQQYAAEIRNQNRENYQARMIRSAMYGPSASAIGKAVGDEIAKHPKINLSWDKRGFNVSVQEANTLRKTQKDKHSLK